MPANELMGWNKVQKRWYKRYLGKLYFVSPRQLKCNPTADASRQSANEWWTNKQREIDTEMGKAKQHPAKVVNRYALAIRNHQVFAWWHRRDGHVELAAKSVIERLAYQTNPPRLALVALGSVQLLNGWQVSPQVASTG